MEEESGDNGNETKDLLADKVQFIPCVQNRVTLSTRQFSYMGIFISLVYVRYDSCEVP